jgi:hypothetical protein
MNIRETFLWQLYKGNKRLLFIIICYLAGACFSAITKMEFTPVYNFNMFAVPFKETQRFYVKKFYVNNSPIESSHVWNYFDNMVLVHSFEYYSELKNKNYQPSKFNTFRRICTTLGINWDKISTKLVASPSEVDTYKTWLIKYLAAKLNTKIYSLRVVEQCIIFDEHNKPKLVASKIVL